MTRKIIYWVSTLWASVGMVSTAIIQIFQIKPNADLFNHLGYPIYFFTFIGILKILGAVALLVPKYPLLKEWAYAGFFFLMTGAIFSHIAYSDPFSQILPSLLSFTIIAISWYTRPVNRRIVPTITINRVA